MRTALFGTAAAAALLAMSPAAFAQDEAEPTDAAPGEQSEQETWSDQEADPSLDADADATLDADAVTIEASTVMDGSEESMAVMTATVTGEDGSQIGTVDSLEFDEEGYLETIVLADAQGAKYDLAATDAQLNAEDGSISTVMTIDVLDPHVDAAEDPLGEDPLNDPLGEDPLGEEPLGDPLGSETESQDGVLDDFGPES